MSATLLHAEVVNESLELTPSELQEAFRQFNETSERLQEKYDLLRREAEELRAELVEKNIEVKRNERLATLGEMAAAIAHEVRNPLGAIRLFLSLLRQDVSKMPGSIELVDNIARSITSLDHVVSNILQFAKDQGIKKAPVNLHAIINEELMHFDKMREKSAKINLELNANPFVIGNDQGLRQVFYNLFLNAFQATKYRGEVSIATGDSGSDLIFVRIHDNGPGIPGDVVDRVFDPFVTTKNEGTGLGLAIVKKIVSQHGGEITAANSGGAEFTIMLPRIAKQDSQEK